MQILSISINRFTQRDFFPDSYLESLFVSQSRNEWINIERQNFQWEKINITFFFKSLWIIYTSPRLKVIESLFYQTRLILVFKIKYKERTFFFTFKNIILGNFRITWKWKHKGEKMEQFKFASILKSFILDWIDILDCEEILLMFVSTTKFYYFSKDNYSI